MKNKILIICVILLLIPGVLAIGNFNISSSIGGLFFVNGTSGNVGIGTTGPGTDLEISDIGNNAELRLRTHATALWADLSYKNADGNLYIINGYETDAAGLGQIRFRIENVTDAMVIDNDGNVGIGTTAPTTPLQVSSTGVNGIRSRVQNSQTNGVTQGQSHQGGLVMWNDDTTANNWNMIGFPISNQAGAAIGAQQTDHTANNQNVELAFFTTNSGDSGFGERMRITSTGNVGIGTTSPDYQLELSLDSAGKPTSNTWTIVSDERIKTNISDFEDGLDKIMNIRPITYNYNGLGGLGYDDNETHIGIIAQELELVTPYMVETRTGKIGGVEVDDFKTYQGHALPFILVNAIQELKAEKDAEIESQQFQIEELKQRLEILEGKL